MAYPVTGDIDGFKQVGDGVSADDRLKMRATMAGKLKVMAMTPAEWSNGHQTFIEYQLLLLGRASSWGLTPRASNKQ